MIEPCRTCGGSGRVQCDGSNHADGVPCGDEDVRSTGTNPWMVCPDCKDLPWLVCDNCGGDGKDYRPNANMNNCAKCGGTRSAKGRGKLKPQRGTVMRWCKTHQSSAEPYGECEHQLIFDKSWRDDHDCDIVWIATPEPLEEAT